MLFKPLADVVAVYKLKLVKRVHADLVPLTLEPNLSICAQANTLEKIPRMPAKNRALHISVEAIVTAMHKNRSTATVAPIAPLVRAVP